MILASQANGAGSNPAIRIMHIWGVKVVTKRSAKIGDRVELVSMDDTMTELKPGDKGKVFKIDENQELIWVNWDNGEQLALLVGVDKFKIIKK